MDYKNKQELRERTKEIADRLSLILFNKTLSELTQEEKKELSKKIVSWD